MATEKEKILRMERKKKKRHREAAAGIGLVVLGVLLAFGITQTSILDINPSTSEKIDYDSEVVISSGIRPYRTSIGENGTVKFTNTLGRTVNITFDTAAIDRKITVAPNSSGYFRAARYENLPYRNYYNLNTGDTGEIVIR